MKMYCEVTSVSWTREDPPNIRFRIEVRHTDGELMLFASGMRWNPEANVFYTGKSLKGGLPPMELAGVGTHDLPSLISGIKAILKRSEGDADLTRRELREVIWGQKRSGYDDE